MINLNIIFYLQQQNHVHIGCIMLKGNKVFKCLINTISNWEFWQKNNFLVMSSNTLYMSGNDNRTFMYALVLVGNFLHNTVDRNRPK